MERDTLAYLRGHYRVLRRPQREKLMCAMIRINYGTAWPGDEERVRHFLPEGLHGHLHLNGLNDAIESLCPISDEPTDSGYRIERPGQTSVESTVQLAVSAIDSQTVRKVQSDS